MVCAILLGLTAHASAGERVQQASLYAGVGETARPPIGWVEFCADNPDDCRGGVTQPRDIVMT